MDAVEFIREEIRMCASYQDCTGCPLYDTAYCSVSPKKRTKEEAEEIVLRVMKWAEEHPVKTRQSVFLEQWPNAEIDCQGVIKISPCDLDKTMHGPLGDCYHIDCDDCRLKFWTQAVENND